MSGKAERTIQTRRKIPPAYILSWAWSFQVPSTTSDHQHVENLVTLYTHCITFFLLILLKNGVCTNKNC